MGLGGRGGRPANGVECSSNGPATSNEERRDVGRSNDDRRGVGRTRGDGVGTSIEGSCATEGFDLFPTLGANGTILEFPPALESAKADKSDVIGGTSVVSIDDLLRFTPPIGDVGMTRGT